MTDAVSLPCVRRAMRKLDDLGVEAISAITESEDLDQLSQPAGAASSAAISQSALLACDRFCTAVAEAEV